jgi:hypothetical protein
MRQRRDIVIGDGFKTSDVQATRGYSWLLSAVVGVRRCFGDIGGFGI